MGTRSDHAITPQLSVRYDYHGGAVDRFGPVSITMERHPDGGEEAGADTASFLMRSELTRAQAGLLKECVDHAIELWDEREKAGEKP